ncbi:MAG: S1 RNA-binding domain-containing protein, partial [Chloroflexota bacterium]
QFGAFVSLDPGIEALLHTSQIAEPPPEDPSLVVHEGQRLLMRVISIESDKQRLGLSLKEVSDEEKQRWLQARADAAPVAVAEEPTDEISADATDEISADATEATEATDGSQEPIVSVQLEEQSE